MQTPPLSVIANPRRQEILRLVWGQERSAGDIHRAMPDVTFGAVSLHLRALSDAGLVRLRRAGRHRHYSADRDALQPFARFLTAMWDDALWRLKLQVELEHTRRGPRSRRVRRAPTDALRRTAR